MLSKLLLSARETKCASAPSAVHLPIFDSGLFRFPLLLLTLSAINERNVCNKPKPYKVSRSFPTVINSL